MNRKAIGRTLGLVLSGAILLQAGGCVTLLAPLALSLVEQLLLGFLLGGA